MAYVTPHRCCFKHQVFRKACYTAAYNLTTPYEYGSMYCYVLESVMHVCSINHVWRN